MDETPGRRFARALAAKDRTALAEVLSTDVDFRGLTPGRSWEASGCAAVVDDIVLGHWFAEKDDIVDLVSTSESTMADRSHVAYRLLVCNPDGDFLVEQQAYYQAEGDQITWMRVLCSGYRPARPPGQAATRPAQWKANAESTG